MDLGSAYLFARRYEEAVTHYQNVLATAPRFAVAYVFLGMAYEQQGRYDAAVAAQQRAIDLGGRNPLWLSALGRAHAVAGHTAEGRAILDELRTRAAQRFVSPFGLALVHAGLGDREAALTALERAVAVRDPYLIYLAVHPQLDTLRADPRFEAVAETMNAAAL
jgi:tetratricopeptide (TPR) repeat protein